MPKIGLALSGGGFRGTLFHLGVVRFLRDSGFLRDVTHITSVSGGSILAAHLVLNWERYNGSPQEFDEVAREILDFVQFDVRNRIVRRFPFAAVGQLVRTILRRPRNRRLSRTGLLESYYQKYLYGDTCLYELPAQPELHMLSTNLSEGCLCSFTRSGLIMQRRLPGDRVQFERIPAGLATVPLAVTASSAFPGFFPPIKLQASDIGASEAAFSPQTFTDGGVFDNLGIRAFRFIERCWSEDCRPMASEGRHVEVEKLEGADDEHEASGGNSDRVLDRERLEAGVATTRELVLRADALPGGDNRHVSGPDEDANHFHEVFSGREPGSEPAPPPHPTPKTPPPPAPGLRPTSAGSFDAVLTSDAGAKLMTHRDAFSGGLIRTAMRASDILMDRVWQLEKEIFGKTPGFLFASIHHVVELEEDPHAPLPVIQRQVLGIRTDLDRFSQAEIRGLVQHGYSVTRQACRSRPDIFGDTLPDGPAWDPIPPPVQQPPSPQGRPNRPPAEPTLMARELQHSAFRHVVSTILDWRDGMTYLFLPVVVALLLTAPCLLAWYYFHARTAGQALAAIAGSNQDEARLIQLVRQGPITSLEGMPHRDVDRLEPPDYRGFEFLSDGHIIDLRRWVSGHLSWMPGREGGIYQYRHFLVRRLSAPGADDHLRFQFTSRATELILYCPNSQFRPVLKRLRVAHTPAGADNGPAYSYELDLDLSKVAVGETVDVTTESLFHGVPHEGKRAGPVLPHNSYGVTKVATMWVLLPDRRHSGEIQLMAYETGHPELKRSVRPTREYESSDGSLLGWQIIGPEPDTTYEGHTVLD